MKRISFLTYSLGFFLLTLTACSGSRKSTNQYETMVVKPADPSLNPPNASAEKKLIARYAAFMKISSDSITNVPLYAFIDKWLKTPYKYGGIDEKGIDCSAFIQRLLGDVYSIQVPRTSAQQFFTKNVEPFHDKTWFSEGDLVFFCTVPGTAISHVGMYLKNRYFINATTSSGVAISNLDEPYWKKRFVAAGRVKITNNPAVINKNSTQSKSAKQ